MTFEHVSDELYELVRGDLPNREMLAVNDHLRECEQCRQDLVDVSMAHALLASVSDLLAPEFSAAGRAPGSDHVGSDLPPLGFLGGPAAPPQAGEALPSSTIRPLRSFERAGCRDSGSPAGSAPANGNLRPAANELPPASLSMAGAIGADNIDAPRRRPHRRRPASATRSARAQRARSAMHRAGLAAISLVVLVFATLLGVGSLRHAPTAHNGRILLAAELVALPAAPHASGSVTVRANGDVTIATAGLTPAPAGYYLEVWFVDRGRSRTLPLGILPSTGKGRFAFPRNLWIGYSGVAVSLQRNGAPPSLGIDMLSTLTAASHSASDSLSAHGSGRPHHPGVGAHHPDPISANRQSRSPAGRVSTSGAGGVPAPEVVRRLLGDKERRLSSGLVLLVDTTRDSNAVRPAGGHCQDSGGSCSLRAALEVANALKRPVTIRLPAGTYALSLGALVASDPAGLSIEGASEAGTVITGNGPDDRLLVVREASGRSAPRGAVLSLSHLTVSGGTAPSTGTWAGDGGAILVANAADLLELSHVIIVDSHAAGAGGGVFARGQVWATATTFENDSAGVSGGGAQFEHGEAVVTNSDFSGDSAGSAGVRGGAGGAIDDNAAALVLVYSSFTNDAVTAVDSHGGALVLRGPAWLSSDTFAQDHAGLVPSPEAAASGAGGALYVASGPATVQASTFEDDEAEGNEAMGGGVFTAASLTLISSRFANDETLAGSPEAAGGDGGAVYDAAQLTVMHSWFSGNSAGNDGGGLYDRGSTAVSDSVFSRNRAVASGGGIYDGGSLVLTDSTLSHGLALLGGGLFAGGSLAASGDAVVDNLATGLGAGGGGLVVTGHVEAALARAVNIARSTIAGNVAPVGAGIAELAGAGRAITAVISRSDIAGNDLPSGAEQDCAPIGTGAVLFLVSKGGNVVGDRSCDLSSPSDRQGSAAQGFWLAASNGSVRVCASRSYGSLDRSRLSSPVVAIAVAPGDGGYWEVTADGAVANFGSASSFGSARGLLGGARVTGFASTPDGGGYWLVTSDGRVFNFGDAAYYGAAPGTHVLAMARSVDGRGYWLLTADGDVLAFGDAPRFANRPAFVAAALAATPDGQGYWVAAANGTVYAFGDATSYGGASTRGVVALLPSQDGRGYLLVNARGEVFAYGDASWSGPASSGPVASAAAT
ncbi:MAG TPA: anti-sigma factor [Acidimicrobiales bacterium]|nr:anti-sigma factor [Acidimicrobiales bacterium]